MKSQKKYLFRAMFLVCMVVTNQSYAMNLFNIALKAMFLSTGTIAASPNVIYPLALNRHEYIRRCPGQNSIELMFRAKIVCNVPFSTSEKIFYSISNYHCSEVKYKPNSFAELCYRKPDGSHTIRIWSGVKISIDPINSNIAVSPCKNPYLSPKNELASEVFGGHCLFRDNTCSSEGQIFANSYSATTFRRCECDADNGYKPVDAARLSSSSALIDDDSDCYLDDGYPNTITSTESVINITESVINSTESVTNITEPVTNIIESETTAELIINTTDIVNITSDFIDEEYVFALLKSLTKNKVLPPIIIIACGIPVLIVIPLCILQYEVSEPEPEPENTTTLQASFITESGNKVFFDVTIAVSNVRGQLAIEGTSSKNNQNSQSWWKKLFSKYRGANEGQQALSVERKQLIPINELGERFMQQYLKQPVTADVDSEDVFEDDVENINKINEIVEYSNNDDVEYICEDTVEYTRKVTFKKKIKVNIKQGITIVEQHQLP